MTARAPLALVRGCIDASRIACPALHWVFAAICLAFGLAFVVVTPPNGAPDELSHEVKIVRVAGGNLFGVDHDLPMPDIEGWHGMFQNSRMFSAPFGFRARDVEAVTGAPLDCSAVPRETHDQVVSYSPLIYLLPAAVYRLSCATGASFGTYLYGARIANLVASCALIALGIAASPTARWPLFYVSLLPSSVYELASISADAMLIGLGMAFVAVAVGTALGEIGARRGFRSLVALGVLVSFSKPSYYCLSWLALAAYPRLRRSGLSPALILTGLAVLPALAQAALLTLGFGAAAMALPSGVDPAVNLALLRDDPLRLLPMLAAVPVHFPFGAQWNIVETLIGKVGWLTVPLPPHLYAVGVLGFLTAACACRTATIPAPFRVFAASVAALSVVAIALPLYLYATPADSDVVLGLQGRYFLPTSAIAVVACSVALGRRASDVAALATVAISLALLQKALFRFVHIYYG